MINKRIFIILIKYIVYFNNVLYLFINYLDFKNFFFLVEFYC